MSAQPAHNVLFQSPPVTHGANSPCFDRQATILEFYPLVRTIAARLARRLPPSVDAEELVNVGVLGLIDAIDRFDPTRGVPFKNYAEIRISGSMFDSLRSGDWVPRSVRRKHNRLEKARAELTFQLGRDPSREEMALKLELGLDELEAMEKDSRISRLVSLDASTTDDGATPLLDTLPRNEPSMEQNMVDDQLRAEVEHAVFCLPEKERAAVTQYYLQGMTLREIGAQLGVTESRACQLRGQGIKRLQFRLKASVA